MRWRTNTNLETKFVKFFGRFGLRINAQWVFSDKWKGKRTYKRYIESQEAIYGGYALEDPFWFPALVWLRSFIFSGLDLIFSDPLPLLLRSLVCQPACRSRLEVLLGPLISLNGQGPFRFDGAVGVGSHRGRCWAARFSPNDLVQLPRQIGLALVLGFSAVGGLWRRGDCR